ncbi:MAG TPA: ATP-binding protein [Anaerolineales bacterium]|nr:ATP-binding protein [Anaerolineales bacterium]
MREIALHLLDIAENSVAAKASEISVSVVEDLALDRLKASIVDNGKGMDAETVQRVVDPFVTSRTTRKVGLGIPLLKAAAEMCNGGLEISSEVGRGTSLAVEFQRSHIDRMPLGDLAGTMLTLVVAYPNIHWLLEYSARLPGDNGTSTSPRFCFDDLPIKEALGVEPGKIDAEQAAIFCEPEVLAFIRNQLEDGISTIQSTIQNISVQ